MTVEMHAIDLVQYVVEKQTPKDTLPFLIHLFKDSLNETLQGCSIKYTRYLLAIFAINDIPCAAETISLTFA